MVCSAWKHAAELKARYLELRPFMNIRIDKKYMESQEIELIGLYTNSDFKEEDIMKHYEKCSKYFTKTIIRKDAISLVNELANMLYLVKNTK